MVGRTAAGLLPGLEVWLPCHCRPLHGPSLPLHGPCLPSRAKRARGEAETPCCRLLWMPFPAFFPANRLATRPGRFHTLNFPGGPRKQPRRTLCYGHAYRYSRSVHEMEPEMPQCVSDLLDFTNELFGLDNETGVNMDLENQYPCGRMSIAEHSDNDAQVFFFLFSF